MILIGITGAISHGKSTFAESLHIQEPGMLHLETNMPIIELANALLQTLTQPIDPKDSAQICKWLSEQLPTAIERHLGRTTDSVDLRLNAEDMQAFPADYQKLLHFMGLLADDFETLHQPITGQNKMYFRPLLQWLGGYLVARLDKAIWIAEVIERAQDYRNAGGTLAVVGGLRFPMEADTIRAAGGSVIRLERPGFAEADTTDPTESSRGAITADCVIFNAGSILDLLDTAAKVLDDAKQGHLQPEYTSAGHAPVTFPDS